MKLLSMYLHYWSHMFSVEFIIGLYISFHTCISGSKDVIKANEEQEYVGADTPTPPPAFTTTATPSLPKSCRKKNMPSKGTNATKPPVAKKKQNPLVPYVLVITDPEVKVIGLTNSTTDPNIPPTDSDTPSTSTEPPDPFLKPFLKQYRDPLYGR